MSRDDTWVLRRTLPVTNGHRPTPGISAGQQPENVVVRGGVEPPTFRFSGSVISAGQTTCERAACPSRALQCLITMDLGSREASPCAARSDRAAAISGSAGIAPTPGRGACRALTGGSPLGSAPPPGQQARARRQAVHAATHPRGLTTARTGRAVLSRRAFSRRAKITVKSARYARVLRTALRAALDCDLPRQTLAPIRRTGESAPRK